MNWLNTSRGTHEQTALTAARPERRSKRIVDRGTDFQALTQRRVTNIRQFHRVVTIVLQFQIEQSISHVVQRFVTCRGEEIARATGCLDVGYGGRVEIIDAIVVDERLMVHGRC